MHLLHDNDRPDLEDGVRTMLHRLAADVSARPPAWEDLVGPRQPRRSPVGATGPISLVRDRRPGRERRPRVSLAAAAVLVLAAAGALAADLPGSGSTGPASEAISAISPGDPSFDARLATAVWATGVEDPVAATQAYLGAVGVPTDAAGPPALALRARTGATAVVEWSVPGQPSESGGTVYLRSASVGGAPPTWTVVGAAADDVALADVRYDGAELSFTVARTSAEADQLAVGVWVDGRPVSLGGDAVAQAGAGDVSLGELLDIGTGADAHDTLQLPVEADDIVTLRVVHVVDGVVRSVTQMAVALPDADPEVAAAGFPPVDASGQATARADAVTDGAGVEAGADGSAGTGLVPGVTVPTLPQLPPLPTPPPVPGLPAPTLPAPPVTAPGSISDRLP